MPTILLATQDPDARVIFREVLERAGYLVRTLEDVDRLVELARTCALVVTNYPTPVSGDCTVTRRLRADPTTAHVPILNATTHAFQYELEEAAAEGVTRTIVLPAEFATIVAGVRALAGAP